MFARLSTIVMVTTFTLLFSLLFYDSSWLSSATNIIAPTNTPSTLTKITRSHSKAAIKAISNDALIVKTSNIPAHAIRAAQIVQKANASSKIAWAKVVVDDWSTRLKIYPGQLFRGAQPLKFDPARRSQMDDLLNDIYKLNTGATLEYREQPFVRENEILRTQSFHLKWLILKEIQYHFDSVAFKNLKAEELNTESADFVIELPILSREQAKKRLLTQGH